MNSSCPIKPQRACHKSAVDSVVELVQDVIPQKVSQAFKDRIVWVRLETIAEHETDIEHVFVIIGYENGIQLYHIKPTGEALEVCSYHNGSTKVFKISQRSGKFCVFLSSLSSSSSKGLKSDRQFRTLNSRFLGSTEDAENWTKTFESSINTLHTNQRLLVVSLATSEIIALSLEKLEVKFRITDCYPNVSINKVPLCLGDIWMAFADSKLYDGYSGKRCMLKSKGGMNQHECTPTMTSTAFSAAKTVASGIGSLLTSFTDRGKRPSSKDKTKSPPAACASPGIVTVVNTSRLNKAEGPSTKLPLNSIVAHFCAHNHEISYLQFDQSGTLLFTADSPGYSFNVYKIHADTEQSVYTRVQHLYILKRGETESQVIDCSFSSDSRWLSVCTARGTTHVFTINPFGGKVTARTHASPYVVNKHTAYQKSAGLSEGATLYDELIQNKAIDTGKQAVTQLVHPVVQLHREEWISKSSSNQLLPNRVVSSLFTQGISDLEYAQGWSHQVRPPTANACDWLLVLCDNGFLTLYQLLPSSPSEVLNSSSKQKTEAERRRQSELNREDLKMSVSALWQWDLQRLTESPDHEDVEAIDTSSSSVNQTSKKEDHSRSAGTRGPSDFDKPWLSQLEMVTYAGPSRRLWVGPQFEFKLFQAHSITLLSDASAVCLTDNQEPHVGDLFFKESIDVESLPPRNLYERSGTKNSEARAIDGGRKRTASTSSGSSRGEEIFIEYGSLDTEQLSDGLDFEFFEDAKAHPNAEEVIEDTLAEAMRDQAIEGSDSENETEIHDLMYFPENLTRLQQTLDQSP